MSLERPSNSVDSGIEQQEDEVTLIIIKPDAYDHGIEEDILREVEALGLQIVKKREVAFTEELIYRTWPELLDHRMGFLFEYRRLTWSKRIIG